MSLLSDLGQKHPVLNVELQETTQAITLVISLSGAGKEEVAGVSIADEGLIFDNSKIILNSIYGSNDFSILFHKFNNVNGCASVVAVNPTRGLKTGVIATIGCSRIGVGDPQFELRESRVTLLNDNNVKITSFSVSVD